MAFDGVMQKLNKDNPNACRPKLILLQQQLKTLKDTCKQQPVQKDDVNIQEERKERIDFKKRKERRKQRIENTRLHNEEIIKLKKQILEIKLPSTISELNQKIKGIIYDNGTDDNTTISDKFLNMFLKPTDDDQSKVLKLQTILQDITLRPYNIKTYNDYDVEKDQVRIKDKSLDNEEDMLKALDIILYNVGLL